MELRVIDKLFKRFEEKGFSVELLNKEEWRSELNNVEIGYIKWGIQNIKGELPSARQFKLMCSPMFTFKVYKPIDHKEWAKKIIRDWQGGLSVKPISLKFAKEALITKGDPVENP
jgi:hypothetical protein